MDPFCPSNQNIYMQVTVTAAVAKINNHFFIKTIHVAAEAKVFANFLFIYFSCFHFLKGVLMVTFTNKMAATDFFPPNPEDGELWLPSFIIHEISTTNAAVLPSHQPAATTTFEVIYLFIFIFHFSASIIFFSFFNYFNYYFLFSADLLRFFWCKANYCYYKQWPCS